MPFSDDVQKALVAGAFGLVGTLIPAAISWSHDRDAASARTRTLDEATKRLAFWEQWLKLSNLVVVPDDPTPAQLQNELQLLREIVQRDSLLSHTQQMRLRGKSTEFQNRLDDLPVWRRLLLLYKPGRPNAWIPRLFFYFGLFFAFLIPFGLAGTPPLFHSVLLIS